MYVVKQFVRRLLTTPHRAALSYPKNIRCNICGWQGSRFLSDEWHPHTVCPSCFSVVRHRLLIAALTEIEELSFTNIIKDRRALHFAPEPLIKSALSTYAGKYVTADISGNYVDVNMDISNMNKFETGSFDAVIACDVLEHVEDDKKALREIHRILSPGGYAILTVPQKDGLEKTFQDPAAVTKEDRKRIYGDTEHRRIYGDDFTGLLQENKFSVTVVSERSFSAETVKRNVLFPPTLSNRPLATNYRKVFFAKK